MNPEFLSFYLALFGARLPELQANETLTDINLMNKKIVEVCNSCFGNSNILLYERDSVDFGNTMNHFLKEQIIETFLFQVPRSVV